MRNVKPIAVEYGRENPETIILLHGGGLSWWNYERTAQMLADRFHVVLPVLDGHAGSGVPFRSIEDCAERIIRWIDEDFGGRVLLLGGLSLGGQIVVEILARRSGICDYAVIESALALPMKATAMLIGPAFSLCYPLIAKRWFAKLQFRSLRIRPELFEQYYHDTARISKADMIAFLRANSDYRLKDALTRCRAKALVIAGGRERRIMKKSARMIADMLPSSEQEIIRGAYHGELSLNHAEEFAGRLLRLMER